MSPLVLHPKLSAIVHLLPNIGEPTATELSGAWPLRVLIVRSNPADLGGYVPAAVPIRKELLKGQVGLAQTGKTLKKNGANDRLSIDLLSREKGDSVLGLPTPDQLQMALAGKAYDVLVYLGHGDIVPSYDGTPPVGKLQLEEEDGEDSVGVPAGEMASYLYGHAPPVVLLLGCVTAAALPPRIQDHLANFVRGSEGVAQALVESESGLQVAIGMRYRIDGQDATLFLKMFFGALLNTKPGNVELAVRAAREKLHFKNVVTSNYSAPVVFSTLRKEPLFPYMSAPPAAPCGALLDKLNDVRTIFWPRLVSQQLSSGSGVDFRTTVYQMLSAAEDSALQPSIDAGSAIVMRVVREAAPDTDVDVDVNLHTASEISLDSFDCDVVVNGEAVRIQGVTAGEVLQSRGFQLLSAAAEGGRVSLSIKRKTPGAKLPAGTLFRVRLHVGPSSQVVHRVTIVALASQPQLICAAGNGVLVPAT
jgi:hypothetical protein